MVQLTKPLYAIAALSDGRRDAQAVAEILTHASNRRFTAADVVTLVEKRLRPVGVLGPGGRHLAAGSQATRR